MKGFFSAWRPLAAICILSWSASLSAQVPRQAFKGWPDKESASRLEEKFVNPPKGYGNVPFFWWPGDTLKLERLSEELELLADASTDGLNISYNHTSFRVDTLENAAGHGPCGVPSEGEPKVFSPQWREIWNEFSKLCAEKGIGLGMDDYVVAWPGNRGFIDEIRNSPGFKDYPGKLKKERVARSAGLKVTPLWSAEAGDSLDIIYVTASPELHPEYGNQVIEKYFQPFEDNMDEEGRKGMNYFFTDELMYYPTITSWCEGMEEIFKARKGYDIIPWLPALFASKDGEVSEEVARVRLDYAEVVTELVEERYFKPIFNWHSSRGLIYGCDNMGRGLRPLQYMDYFRAISWYTAPGNDAPARGSSFRQTKVSSSIAHMYNRPRTWLEAFHSMGWDANGGVLTRQLDHHLIAGGNLLCLHGLYYSTHGGWWEWAPPSFHFRMPYWPHMKHWLKYAERMCYVLSQGDHVCDIAVLYPTETMQAYPQAKPDLTFDVSLFLSDHGLDYDFIDYKSIQNADVSTGRLDVSSESYKVLLLADTRAMHGETLAKIREFISRGGIVLTVGESMASVQASKSYDRKDYSSIAADIRGLLTPDFTPASGEGKVLHRRIGERDLYMVMDVKSGDEMTFRSAGKAERWDALHGTRTPVEVIRTDGKCSTVRFEGATGTSEVIVFSPGEPLMASGETATRRTSVSTKPVKGEWDIEIIPTMNNKWGDFRLPATDGLIGAEAREFSYKALGTSIKSSGIYGYTPYMRTRNLPAGVDLDAWLSRLPDTSGWDLYPFSWQYGVFDSPGSQGYHGLKAKVDEKFLILDQGGHQLFAADMYVPRDGAYEIVRKGVEPYRIFIDNAVVASQEVNLSQGWHSLLLAYKDTKKTEYDLKKLVSSTWEFRDRSMVMLYPKGSEGPKAHGLNDSIVASSWWDTGFVPFDCKGTGRWQYRFETAPGTRSMLMTVCGEIERIKAGGKTIPSGSITRNGDTYEVRLPGNLSGTVPVEVIGKPSLGHPGPAFFTEPVKMVCDGGKLRSGDWTSEGALKFFSGGIRYGKDVRIESKGRQVSLDLGEVDATCEVQVNGQDAGVLLSGPYELDITSYVRDGQNRIEVLVYSSLANHYQTIPTPYRGQARSGLIGPVKLVYR